MKLIGFEKIQNILEDLKSEVISRNDSIINRRLINSLISENSNPRIVHVNDQNKNHVAKISYWLFLLEGDIHSNNIHGIKYYLMALIKSYSSIPPWHLPTEINI